MKYKYIGFITAFILGLCIIQTINVKADTINDWPYVAIVQLYPDSGYYVIRNWTDITDVTGGPYYSQISTRNFSYVNLPNNIKYGTLADAVNHVVNGGFFESAASSAVVVYGLITVKGTTSGSNIGDGEFFGSYQDYLNSLDKPWYTEMWDKFRDFWNDPALGNWVQNLINHIFGDDNGGSIADNVTITAPTLTPAPTPIPYTTVVIPKTDIISGDTVYETNYYYKNPSGTPIITSSPPTNPPASGGGGGGSTEYVPVGGDPFSIPAVNWLTSATIGDNSYDGIDNINGGMDSIDAIGSEYTDGMSVVEDSTGTLPTSWLLLVGVAAAIPLLAGIVSRFLGG